MAHRIKNIFSVISSLLLVSSRTESNLDGFVRSVTGRIQALSRANDFIIDSRVGALDRTLGFLYGAARGILVVAVGLLFFNWLVGDNAPSWVLEAKSRPLLESIGTALENALPDDPENSILERFSPDESEPAPAEPSVPETPPAN